MNFPNFGRNQENFNLSFTPEVRLSVIWKIMIKLHNIDKTEKELTEIVEGKNIVPDSDNKRWEWK